ncbi:hypothetical protein [Ktedonosporobacter rubrisoli]|nr:hypothetical protein [Ktedonosporobacter rubrisoli]
MIIPTDREAHLAFSEVLQMLKPASALFKPTIALKVLRYALIHRH